MENSIFENLKWKTTQYGLNIALYSSQEEVPKNSLLIIGGVHGDEPEGVYLCEKLLSFLKNSSTPAIHPWVLIPNINPEGSKKNQRTNGNGVDLNRNFPSKDWSSQFKQPRYNPGPHPGSELETQALVELISHISPRIIIHCHSWKPSIVYTASTPPKEALILSQVSGYELQADIGYPTPGSLGQFGFFEHHIPVICIEESEGVSSEDTWNRFHLAFKEILFGANP